MLFDRPHVRGALGALCVLAVIVAGCGSSTPTKSSKKIQDGKVIVRNDTDSVLDVEYFDEDQGEIVKATVEGNETKEISPEPLEAGTKLTVKITAQTATTMITNAPRAQVPVTINGNVTIRIKRVEGTAVYSGLIDWEITGS